MEIIEKAINAQGAENAKKQQAISKTYTLTQLAAMIRKLKELKWINEAEGLQMEKIRRGAVEIYIKELM